jgi:hypothetical protein
VPEFIIFIVHVSSIEPSSPNLRRNTASVALFLLVDPDESWRGMWKVITIEMVDWILISLQQERSPRGFSIPIPHELTLSQFLIAQSFS